jgi:diguanylate cyclase (GGDEF)-like protein
LLGRTSGTRSRRGCSDPADGRAEGSAGHQAGIGTLKNELFEDVGEEIQQDELRSFARSVAEVEWLLLILVLLYQVAPGTVIESPALLNYAIIAFAAFIIVFRYLNFYRRDTRLKIAIESLAMVAFITAVLKPTGGAESPLLNLYLLPIIVSALTLGKWVTLLTVLLISTCYIFVTADLSQVFTLAWLSQIMAKLAPFLLAAFVTTMLASDIQIAKSRIRALSETDRLTGLLNMRAFSRFHRREHDKAVRYGRDYSVLLLDMDNLKQVNDAHGYDAGDKVIVLAANVIARLIRNTDVAARYGGDEFVILLTETDGEKASEIGQRIRNSIHKTTLDWGGRMIRASASVGVAAFPKDAKNPRDLIVQADHDMYRNKELRRAPTAE